MSQDEQKDLITGEGVNQGSADSTDEDAGTAGDTGALAAASQAGRPEDEGDPAPPVDMETASSREAKEGSGTGQQLQAGEG